MMLAPTLSIGSPAQLSRGGHCGDCKPTALSATFPVLRLRNLSPMPLHWVNPGGSSASTIPTANSSAPLRPHPVSTLFRSLPLSKPSFSRSSGPASHLIPCGQTTRRGPSRPEKSRILFLINVSVSATFNELVVEPLYVKSPSRPKRWATFFGQQLRRHGLSPASATFFGSRVLTAIPSNYLKGG